MIMLHLFYYLQSKWCKQCINVYLFILIEMVPKWHRAWILFLYRSFQPLLSLKFGFRNI